MVDDKTKLAWWKCYVDDRGGDTHQAFADELSIGRIEAKRLCYEVAYKLQASSRIKPYYVENKYE